MSPVVQSEGFTPYVDQISTEFNTPVLCWLPSNFIESRWTSKSRFTNEKGRLLNFSKRP
jgi:hypothetical protein